MQNTGGFFYGVGHSFLPSGSLFALILEDLQEESSRFLPHNYCQYLSHRGRGGPGCLPVVMLQ